MKVEERTFRQNIKLVLKLGAGFFADAYDLFVIDIVLSILQEQSLDGAASGMGFDISTKSLIASATSVGAVVGMLLFGFLGDIIGRRLGVLITGSMVAIGSVLSALSFRSDYVSLCTQLTIYRTLLGVGIGGEYPLSATMASEGADASVRGRVVAGVFSMQGVGMLFSSLLAYILVKSGASLDFTWRFLLAFGAVPALVALWFRLQMKDSHHRRGSLHLHATSGTVSAPPTMVTTSPPPAPGGPALRRNRSIESLWEAWYVIKDHGRPLFATTMAWFLLDITFYGTGEFKHSVGDELFPTTNQSNSPSDKVAQDALFGVIISAIALPGYICACIFIDRIGRWNLQVYGFGAMVVTYLVMALSIQLNCEIVGLNLFIFGLTFFFTNFGPNTTTFIVPSEIYPKAIRATCHGLSAAMGKVGAIVGTAGFPPTVKSVGLFGVMYICAGIAMAGLLVTVFFLSKKLVKEAGAIPRDPHATINHAITSFASTDSSSDDTDRISGNTSPSSCGAKKNIPHVQTVSSVVVVGNTTNSTYCSSV